MAAAKKDKPAKKTSAAKAKIAAADTTGAATKVVKFQDHTIKVKRSGRYLVLGKDGKVVNGAEKNKILLGAKLIKESLPKAKEEAAPSA